MSILIKDMEMPKRCAECLMREPLSDYCELLLRYLDREELNGRDADCPLVELPEKHGKLVDADALIEDIRKNSESYFADDFAREWLDRQSVIVEAEGER